MLKYLKYEKEIFHQGFREGSGGGPEDLFLLGENRQGAECEENSDGKLSVLD